MALLLKHAVSCSPKILAISRLLPCSFRLTSHKADHDASHIVQQEHVIEAPKDTHEIYRGMLTKQVRAVKTFSLGTSLIGISMQPILYEHISNSENSVTILVALSSVIGFFTFFTPFLIHYVTKKYVTGIVYDPAKDEYTATVLNLILTKKKINFKLEDITVPDVPGAFTSFLVRKTPLMCSPNDFLYPEHYIRFMGYDKPIDFHLNTREEKHAEKHNQEK